MSFLTYVAEEYMHILFLLQQHIALTAMAVGISVLIGVPLGILISYQRNLQKPIIGFANLMQAVPSLALLGFAIPFFGIGKTPAVIVVILYSLLPILKNTYAGISQINPSLREAAIGIGLSRFQLLTKVEIPLALPIIMAGVRISSVTAVGLVTIAAFIGAGGLGDLVFAGIRTIDNNQILAGAIPACILALFVDYLLGQVELLTTPISTALANKQDRKKVFSLRKRAKALLFSVCAILLIGTGVSAYQAWSTKQADIVVGSKNFTENIIVGHMMSDLIENRTGMTVERHMNLGGTQVAQEALRNGNIDLYLDYTGTIYLTFLKHEPSSDPDLVYTVSRDEMLRDRNILVLPPFGFNNTYTISVTKEFAAAHNLKTISDLAPIAKNMKVGTTFEFLNRPDGLPGLLDMYGFTFGKSIGIDDSARYLALNNGEVEAVDAFSTEGLLKKFDLVVLEDDRQFFPPYYAVPLLRKEVGDAHPEIIDALNELGPLLTEDTMRELNYLVDEKQQSPQKVARDFLMEQHLLP